MATQSAATHNNPIPSRPRIAISDHVNSSLVCRDGCDIVSRVANAAREPRRARELRADAGDVCPCWGPREDGSVPHARRCADPAEAWGTTSFRLRAACRRGVRGDVWSRIARWRQCQRQEPALTRVGPLGACSTLCCKGADSSWRVARFVVPVLEM
jgi:hypothetical protein